MQHIHLRDMLRDLGMSQTEFARVSGISQPVVSRLCRNPEHKPSLDNYLLLERAVKALSGRCEGELSPLHALDSALDGQCAAHT